MVVIELWLYIVAAPTLRTIHAAGSILRVSPRGQYGSQERDKTAETAWTLRTRQ